MPSSPVAQVLLSKKVLARSPPRVRPSNTVWFKPWINGFKDVY